MIEIFDDLITFSVRSQILNFIQNSNYRLVGWQDREDFDREKLDIHSAWSLEDLQRSNLMPYVEQAIKQSKFNIGIEQYQKCVVNLVKAGDVYHTHVHRDQYGLLYYANLEWFEHYAGETLFFDKFKKEVVKAISFVPGRIIVFDGDIPHTIRPQSSIGPQFRFTLTVFFDKTKRLTKQENFFV